MDAGDRVVRSAPAGAYRQLEAFVQAEHSPELRKQIAAGHYQAHLWLAALFGRIGSTADEESSRAVGSFHPALLNGLMVQWLLNPDRAPSGRDMAGRCARFWRASGLQNNKPAHRRHNG